MIFTLYVLDAFIRENAAEGGDKIWGKVRSTSSKMQYIRDSVASCEPKSRAIGIFARVTD